MTPTPEQRQKAREGANTMSKTKIGTVLADVWTSFPNVHLRVLEAEYGRREIQICDCGMSGHCRPQAFAFIERHNIQTVIDGLLSASKDKEK